MPTKSLLESARVYSKLQHASEFGIRLPSGSMEIDGVVIYPSTRLKDLNKDQKKAIFENDKGLHEVQSDLVLVSIGRKTRVNNLGLEDIGIDYSRQGIKVNEQMQTNTPNIYACGDVIGGIQLAHVAFHEGTVAASNACGMDA
jgi:dihydrolipoamide dehydrogenase